MGAESEQYGGLGSLAQSIPCFQSEYPRVHPFIALMELPFFLVQMWSFFLQTVVELVR